MTTITQYEDKTITEFWTIKKDKVLYLNNRLEEKERIMFMIGKADSRQKIKDSVQFFMDLSSLRHLIHKVLYSPLKENYAWERVRVTQTGSARAITIKKSEFNNQYNYSIKIDHGKGTYGDNGPKMTSQTKTDYLYIPEGEMERICLDCTEFLQEDKLKKIVSALLKERNGGELK